MIVGVEHTPQLQPATCSFSGHSSSSCDKFIRITSPDEFYDTFLISDHFFKQMADEMGYVELQHDSYALKELQGHLDELAPIIHSLLSELTTIRQRLDSLQVMETHIDKLKATVDRLARSSNTALESSASKKPIRLPSPAIDDKSSEVDLFG